jgi:hypothetical protein
MAENDLKPSADALPAGASKTERASSAPADLASPHEHAKALGSFRDRASRPGSVVVSSVNGQSVNAGQYSWQHAAAASLHGWAEHEHHEAKPLRLSPDDYKAALLAASAPVVRATEAIDRVVPNGKEGARVSCKKGDKLDLQKLDVSTEDLANAGVPFVADYEPHAAALSKHAAYSKTKVKG